MAKQLFVTSLVPIGATLDAVDELEGEEADWIATDEPMVSRLRVEAPAGSGDVRFLHVLQGADAGVEPDPVVLVHSSSGDPFSGAAVVGTLVLFPETLGPPFTRLTVELPDDVDRVLVTGLAPDGEYVSHVDGGVLVVEPGTGQRADAGGVLVVEH